MSIYHILHNNEYTKTFYIRVEIESHNLKSSLFDSNFKINSKHRCILSIVINNLAFSTMPRISPKKVLIFSLLALASFMIHLTVRQKLKSSKPRKVQQQHNSRCDSLYQKTIDGLSVPQRSKIFSRKADHFPESRLHVDTTSDEKKCPELYQIAREMLNGEKIKLPYETSHTRWKFRDSIDLDVLAKTHLHWNYPWDQGDSEQTRRKLQIYNVSASTIPARKYVITYGHNCCKMSKVRAVNQAIDVGKADFAEALDLSELSVPFQIAHQNLLRHRKGAGYWLWKPYIILKTLLTKLNDGDFLIFHDAGSYFVKDLGPLYKVCMHAKPSVLTFNQPYSESKYSKRDAFILMGMDKPQVYEKTQTQRLSGLQVYMKSCTTIQFLMELLAYSSDRRIVSDDKNVMGEKNFEGFVGNRHDQTVLSLLSKKWGIVDLRDPCTCGRNKFTQNYKYASGPYHAMYVNDRVRV